MPTKPDERRLAELGQLYDRLATSLYRYAAMLLADPVEAEDVVQRVFAAVAIRRLAAIESIEGYLRRSVRNECFSVLRQNRRRPVAPVEALLEMTSANGSVEERFAVEEALRTLPADQREVLYLKAHEGLTFPEIAALSGESPNTIASRYRYGMEKLRALLGDRTK